MLKLHVGKTQDKIGSQFKGAAHLLCFQFVIKNDKCYMKVIFCLSSVNTTSQSYWDPIIFLILGF